MMLLAIDAIIRLLLIQHHAICRTRSTAIRAEALHYAIDLATNITTVAALILARVGWPALDSVFALGIAAYILYSVSRITIDAVHPLMDREPPLVEAHRISLMTEERLQPAFAGSDVTVHQGPASLGDEREH